MLSEDSPSGEITFDESISNTILLQIPKNIPRTTNLDFGHFSLYAIQTDDSWIQIRETESQYFYILEIPVNDSDYIEIVGGSVATGRWEQVTIENDSCNDLYAGLTTTEEQIFELPPLKQFMSEITIDDIQCKKFLVLMSKHDGTPACMTQSTIPKLSDGGWSWVLDLEYWEEDYVLIRPTNYDVKTNDGTYSGQYMISGVGIGSVSYDEHLNSLTLFVNSTERGVLQITVPR